MHIVTGLGRFSTRIRTADERRPSLFVRRIVGMEHKSQRPAKRSDRKRIKISRIDSQNCSRGNCPVIDIQLVQIPFCRKTGERYRQTSVRVGGDKCLYVIGIVVIIPAKATRVVKRSGGIQTINRVRSVMHAVIRLCRRWQGTVLTAKIRLPTRFLNRAVGVKHKRQRPDGRDNRERRERSRICSQKCPGLGFPIIDIQLVKTRFCHKTGERNLQTQIRR